MLILLNLWQLHGQVFLNVSLQSTVSVPAHVPQPVPAPVATPPSKLTTTSQSTVLPPQPAPAAVPLHPVKRTSGFIGCHWHRGAGKWVAQISIACKRTHLGYFSTELEAARKYDEKAQELGRPTNFPKGALHGEAPSETSPVRHKPNALIVGATEGYTKGPYKKRQKTATSTSSPVGEKVQHINGRASAEEDDLMGNIGPNCSSINESAVGGLVQVATSAKPPNPSPVVEGPVPLARPSPALPSAASAPQASPLQTSPDMVSRPQTPPRSPATTIAPTVVVHLSDHNPVMVAQVDYHIRAEQSINGKETTEYIHKVSMI